MTAGIYQTSSILYFIQSENPDNEKGLPTYTENISSFIKTLCKHILRDLGRCGSEVIANSTQLDNEDYLFFHIQNNLQIYTFYWDRECIPL